MAKRIPRIRIIAGPNGSGKSTLVNQLRMKSEAPNSRFSLGYFLNADDLLIQLNLNGFLDFNQFNLSPENKSWKSFLEKENSILDLSKKSLRVRNLLIRNNKIVFGRMKLDAYVASFLVEFLRDEMLRAKVDFSFETVFSHPSKMALIQKAKRYGYRVYLYYVATGSPLVNISRVKNRTMKGGHDVSNKKIIDRYHASLALLPKYILDVNRAYLWDNSRDLKLIAEITEGETLETHESNVPLWVYTIITQVNFYFKP